MNLMNLPNEVLMLIFEFLEGNDRLMVNMTCRRFSEILKQKRLSRILDLDSNYWVPLSYLKSYFKPKVKQENIRVLDITSCCWINSSEIRILVKKMVNLEAFYAADTLLSKEHLVLLLPSLPQLKKLSFTWTKVLGLKLMRDLPLISHRLHALEFLLIYLKTDDLSVNDTILIVNWLHFCSALKELRMIAPRQKSWLESYPSIAHSKPLSFPCLHTLVLSVPGSAYATSRVGILYDLVMQFTEQLKNWQCWWTTTLTTGWIQGCPDTTLNDAKILKVTYLDGESLRKNLPNLEHLMVDPADMSTELFTFELPKLKKLFWSTSRALAGEHSSRDVEWMAPEWQMDWNGLWNLCSSLEELNIGNCMKDIKEIHFQESLTKLALPTCILKGSVSQPSSKAEQSNLVIRVIVESCPNIREFEFTCCSVCAFKPSGIVHEPTLAVFGKWKYLQRLKLEGLECIRTGNSLSHILKMCENLESISFKNLGHSGVCSYLSSVCKGLEKCKNLKEFRLEQPNILSVDNLLLALKTCSKLGRICIISPNHTKPPQYDFLVNMARQLEKLVFLYLDIASWSKNCKRLAKQLNVRIRTSRPSFQAIFMCGSMENNDVATMSGKHYFEMREDVSRISTMPRYGKKFLSI